jgi:hypothetical protein
VYIDTKELVLGGFYQRVESKGCPILVPNSMSFLYSLATVYEHMFSSLYNLFVFFGTEMPRSLVYSTRWRGGISADDALEKIRKGKIKKENANKKLKKKECGKEGKI